MASGNTLGTFATSTKTAAAGTPWAQGIDPWRGQTEAAMAYSIATGSRNWEGAYTHISKLMIDCGSTAHTIGILRPLNYALVNGDAAINQAVINLVTDPGAYSTAYKYTLPSAAAGLVSCVANNPIAAGDYCAYQLRDGTWIFDTVASVATLAITMSTVIPNVTGGGVVSQSIFFFFGVLADVNPATGQPHTNILCKASTREDILFSSGADGDHRSIRKGDPMIVYNANATVASTLVTAAGYYSTT